MTRLNQMGWTFNLITGHAPVGPRYRVYARVPAIESKASKVHQLT